MPFHVMPNELLRGGNLFSSRGRKVTLTVVTAVTQVTPWVMKWLATESGTGGFGGAEQCLVG